MLIFLVRVWVLDVKCACILCRVVLNYTYISKTFNLILLTEWKEEYSWNGFRRRLPGLKIWRSSGSTDWAERTGYENVVEEARATIDCAACGCWLSSGAYTQNPRERTSYVLVIWEKLPHFPYCAHFLHFGLGRCHIYCLPQGSNCVLEHCLFYQLWVKYVTYHVPTS